MPGRGQNRTAAMPRHSGWWRDGVNDRLVAVFNGTEVFDFDANDIALSQALATVGIVSASGNIVATTGDIIATAGAVTVTAGDAKVTAGNLRLGAISTFGTTEPTSAVVMKAGTAPAGAITTSGGIFATATVVQKIIAAGTVSNVET